MSVRKEIIDCSELRTTSRIDVNNLPTGENFDSEENVDNDISDLLELVEDEYSRDVFENENDENDEMDNNILVATKNEYVKNVVASTGLHVIQQKTVLEAWHNRGPVEVA